MRKTLVRQPFGLGDIIYTRKIYHYFNKATGVVWPIIDKYLWLNDYLEGAGYVPLSSMKEHKHLFNDPYPCRETNKLTEVGDYKFIPLNTSNIIKGGLLMRSKYDIVGLSFEDWQEYFDLKRNHLKELELYNKFNINEPYALVNRYFRPTNVRANIPVKTDLRIIEMSTLEGYTLFDWSLILEKATEIWTMDTSLTLLTEKLNLSNIKKLKLFTRHGTIKQCEYLYRLPWEITCYSRCNRA